MSNKQAVADWSAAVARERIGEVLAVIRCALTTADDPAGTRGELHIGQWAALFVPEELLRFEFDAEAPQLHLVEYRHYGVALYDARLLVPTARVRFDSKLTVVGQRRPMRMLYELWDEDRSFDRSTGESWA